MIKLFIPTALYLLLFNMQTAAQSVSINDDASLPTPGAMLDIKSSTKGVIIPRISLTGTNDVNSVPLRTESLLIYNTITVTGANAVSPGFYYWDGSAWLRLTTNSNALLSGWLLGGNSGTSTATHFLGTSDNISLQFKVNNQKAGYIGVEANDGNIFWGYQSGQNNTGYSNVAIGTKALYTNTTQSNLVAIGDSALFNNTSGITNTAVGSKSLFSNTTGIRNTANGSRALYSNTTGSYNTANGESALTFTTTGIRNSAHGFYALRNNTTGSHNTGNGSHALYYNTEGSLNTAHGAFALFSNTTGSNNTSNGYHSLFLNSSGNSNVAIGVEALYNNTDASNLVAIGDSALFSNTGLYNTAVGSKSLFSNTTGMKNTANGSWALYSNTTGSYNTATGESALSFNTTGIRNSAHGFYALRNNTTGIHNTGNGSHALYYNTEGSYNTANGAFALLSNTTGSNNIGTGSESLNANTTGSGNTALGDAALYLNSTGSLNTAVGRLADVGLGSLSNATAIGANSRVDCSNCLVLGSVNTINGATSNVNVGIGTNTPTAPLTFGQSLSKKIVLFTGPFGDAGFGVHPGEFRIHADDPGTSITFGSDIRPSSFTENMRLTGGGNLLVRGSVTANSIFYSSDSRYKKNITPIGNALEKVIQLHGYTYFWKDEEQDPTLQSGVIAQEVQTIFPELVKSDSKGYLSVNYAGLIPYLIQSIKEQQGEITKQQSQLNLVRKENEELKTVKAELAELKKMVEKLVD